MTDLLQLEDVQAALHQAFEAGREPVGIALHPGTAIHVSDPALGLPPLMASEIDAIDGLPILIDPFVEIGEIDVRERA